MCMLIKFHFAEKLKKLQASTRTGGKGTVRRKHKAVRSGASGDAKKIGEVLKRSNVTALAGCEEATLFYEDGSAIQFTNPKVQANVNANTYFISGKSEKVDAAGFGGSSMGGNDDVPDLVPVFE